MCVSCLGDLADIALKCNTCKGCVHLRCSGMPDYQLARLSVSQAHYLCNSCVKEKDFDGDTELYSSECTKIQEIIAKELSIIEQTNLDANRTGNNLESEKVETEQTEDNKEKSPKILAIRNALYK